MEKFVITRKQSGMFQFDFRDKKGKIVLQGGEYTRKIACIKGIKSVKLSSQDSTKFKNKKCSDDKYYFNVKALNGKIIGISSFFKTRITRNNKQLMVKKFELDAYIEDLSKDKCIIVIS